MLQIKDSKDKVDSYERGTIGSYNTKGGARIFIVKKMSTKYVFTKAYLISRASIQLLITI